MAARRRSDPTVLTGRPGTPRARLALRAGPVTVELDGADLRRVRVGDVELVQRVYAAVRDAPWNTIPGRFADWTIASGPDRFTVGFRARHAHEAIDFTWRGRIEGTPDGTIRYELDGVCNGTFAFSKIGFNVHHALDGTIGRPYRATTDAGEIRGVLPDAIDPQRIVDGTLSGMFEPYREIAIEVRDGVEAVVALEGDLLELQDHRNWADGNFKSYATPLALGFPFTSVPGQRIRQVLTVGFRGTPRSASVPGPVIIELGERVGPMPALGFGQPGHGRALSAREAQRIAAARPSHLRVDLVAGDPSMAEAFDRAVADARAVGAGLELAVHANDRSGPGLADLAARIGSSWVSIARVLVYPRTEGYSAVGGTTPAVIVALVREHLEPVTGAVPFAGGTNQNLGDINRDRPSDPGMTGICYSLSPTVHAADDLSIVENVVGASETARMARMIAEGRPVSVSPVTLATRFGPYPAGPAGPGGMPPAVDVRQASLLGAAWTTATLKHLAEHGAASVTWFETTGWQGIIERDDGAPHPAFPSSPGQAYPMYHVFADVGEWRAGRVHRTTSSRPLVADALAIADTSGVRILVANLTPDEVRVDLVGLPVGTAAVRALDADSTGQAMDAPEAFRADAANARTADVTAGRVRVDLGGYAVARVDVSSLAT